MMLTHGHRRLLCCLLAASLLAACDDGGHEPVDTSPAADLQDGTSHAPDAHAPDDDTDAPHEDAPADTAQTHDTEPDLPPEVDLVDADETLDVPGDVPEDAPEDTHDLDLVSDGDDDTLPGDVDDEDTVPVLVPLPGFGIISGTCGVLDDELFESTPSFFVNTLDFEMNGYDPTELSELTPGGQEIIADGNAGGSSVMSEVFSYEVLARCELAELIKTENEIVYIPAQSRKTDLLVRIDGEPIGVSVTRAVGWPRDDPYTVQQARTLLEDKLSDILISSANVSPADAWRKQILHVIAYAPMHADSLEAAFELIDPAIKADTIVWVTVSEGDDLFIYNE